MVFLTDIGDDKEPGISERAIDDAVRACGNDSRALAAFGIFLWARASNGDVAAGERTFLAAVRASGGDWVAAGVAVTQIIAPDGFNLEPQS